MFGNYSEISFMIKKGIMLWFNRPTAVGNTPMMPWVKFVSHLQAVILTKLMF